MDPVEQWELCRSPIRVIVAANDCIADPHGENRKLMAGSHGGSPKSWLAVIIILVGFAVGGVALCVGPNWMVFWAGAAIIAIGGVVALMVDIFSDVIVDAPRVPMDHSSRGN